MKRWIFKRGSKTTNHVANVGIICFQAAIVATILQWGTTRASILAAYNAPVIGLGCAVNLEPIYSMGSQSLLFWFFLVLRIPLKTLRHPAFVSIWAEASQMSRFVRYLDP